MKPFTKEQLLQDFKNISMSGWISNNYRSTSSGNVGNILEDQLGIAENNLKLPDAGDYEIKAQKVKMQPNSLLTLFHNEPKGASVPYLLENYGWKPTVWKLSYPEHTRSFRQTLTQNFTDRGFRLQLHTDRIKVVFDAEYISKKHTEWRQGLNLNTEFNSPFWSYDTLREKLNTKLKNCIYSIAGSRTINGVEQFCYINNVVMEDFSFDKFLEELNAGNILVDFDARTGHNHGTKFRCRQNVINRLYNVVTYL